jgi:hypothetical protein
MPAPLAVLRCPRCFNERLIASNRTRHRNKDKRRRGGTVLQVHLRCRMPDCKYAWWSRHTAAMMLAELQAQKVVRLPV